MKKIFVALALAALATSSYASVENSKHDFNLSTTYTANKASRCVYCHVPHNAQTWANVALWATGQASGTFTFYSSAKVHVTSVDIQKSQTCLACHADGSVGVTGLGQAVTGAALLDYNLQNDHPIGNDAIITPGSNGMKTPIVIGRQNPVVSGATVECATCHSVHGNSSYTIQGRKLLYGRGDSGNAAGWASTEDFCNICHTR